MFFRSFCQGSKLIRMAVFVPFVPAAIFSHFYGKPSIHTTACSSTKPQAVVASIVSNETIATKDNDDEDDEDDDKDWEAEKEKCSFCKFFIESPCKKHFKKWSKCVDKAKEDETDFASVCSEFTQALMLCTSQHPEYFSGMEDAADDAENGQKQGPEVDLLDDGIEIDIEDAQAPSDATSESSATSIAAELSGPAASKETRNS
mmetsp:Transcript_28070/g.47218  ORF Transcript_28070/g.47218 Transcript_28070/m.47218 type:complete len:203 (-) Transcript_28070:161-769(-)